MNISKLKCFVHHHQTTSSNILRLSHLGQNTTRAFHILTNNPLRQVVSSESQAEGFHSHPEVAHQNFPPFVKDLFLGKFNKSVLSYAEVLNDESHFNLENKIDEIEQFLESRADVLEQVDRTGKISPEIITSFKQSGLFGLSIPKEYGGADFLNTEIARFYEAFGCELSLSEFLGNNELLGYRALLMAGTVEQKARYLPRLARGEMVATWCLAEAGAGSDPDSVATVATAREEGWELQGTKTWVANAQGAQLFTVFAKVKVENSQGEEEERLTCFLVDRTECGEGELEISEPYAMSGLKGLEACDVKFNNCKVPSCSVLGTPGQGLSVLQSVQHQNKYIHAAGVTANLRGLLDSTIQHTKTRKQFGLPLSDFALVRQQMAKMAARLYCLESMVFLTAGLADVSQHPDVDVESVIVQQYAAEASDFIVSGCLGLLGAQVNLETSRYQKYMRESHVVQGWHGTSNINKCFIGISGLMHLVKHQPELGDIRQMANGNFLKHMKYRFQNWEHLTLAGKVSMKHDLAGCVHQALQPAARRLEWCVLKLHFVAQELLINRGANIQVEEHYLERLSDLVTEVYATTCALSRASRSSTLGLENHEIELNTVVPISFESKQRVKLLTQSLLHVDHDLSNRDEYLERCGEYMARYGGYMPVHPLTKNSF